MVGCAACWLGLLTCTWAGPVHAVDQCTDGSILLIRAVQRTFAPHLGLGPLLRKQTVQVTALQAPSGGTQGGGSLCCKGASEQGGGGVRIERVQASSHKSEYCQEMGGTRAGLMSTLPPPGPTDCLLCCCGQSQGGPCSC